MMEKIKINFLLVIMMVMSAGCEKAPENFDVEQQWILENFTILDTQETVQCQRLYYCITYMVTAVVEKQGPTNYGSYIARTEYREGGTVLVLKDFKVRWETGDSGVDATPEQLKPFGIINPKETVFHIVKNDGKQMILQSDYARLQLKCF